MVARAALQVDECPVRAFEISGDLTLLIMLRRQYQLRNRSGSCCAIEFICTKYDRRELCEYWPVKARYADSVFRSFCDLAEQHAYIVEYGDDGTVMGLRFITGDERLNR